MRAACRNCRFHHAKCNFKPPKAPGRRAPLSSRIPVTLVMRTAAPSNRTSLQRSHPRRPVRFFSAADRPQPTLLGYRRKGGVQRSEAFGLFIDDACHGTAQGSGLNSKMAASRKLAARREPQLDLVEGSPAGSHVCSATSRVRAVLHQPSSLCVTARYYHPLLIATGVRFKIAPTKGPSVGQHNDEILGSLGETSALTPHGKIQKMEIRRRFAGHYSSCVRSTA